MVSQKGILIRNGKCLIVELTNWPGYWDLPGGRVDEDEECEAAFRREIREETGLSDFEIIQTVDHDLWYTKHRHLPMCGIASLIRCDKGDIRLSVEHRDYKWIGEDELHNYLFFWKNARRMIRKGFECFRNIKESKQSL